MWLVLVVLLHLKKKGLDADGVSASGFGHPECGAGVDANNAAIVGACPSGDGMTAGCLD